MSSTLGAEGAIYYSFLLRLWQVPTNGEHAWRILLENVQSGEKCGFASTEELFIYLRQITKQEDTLTGKGS
jgi:hypothetical protein